MSHTKRETNGDDLPRLRSREGCLVAWWHWIIFAGKQLKTLCGEGCRSDRLKMIEVYEQHVGMQPCVHAHAPAGMIACVHT